MIINIYKDPMQTGYLFDTPILYSPRPILREDVPQGWHCCDLCGTAKAPDVPYKLVDQAERNYAGSILSNQPLKNGKAQSRLLKDAFWLSGESATLDEFCMNESIPLPQTPITYRYKEGRTVSLTFKNQPKGAIIVRKRDSQTG